MTQNLVSLIIDERSNQGSTLFRVDKTQHFIFSRNKKLKDCHEEINFQTEFVMDLAKDSGYGYDLDISEILHSWLGDKDRDILTYRDVSFASKFTKTQSPIHHSTFMSALDDSMAGFLSTKK